MGEVTTSGCFVLLFDVVLSLAGWAGLVLPECSCCSRLAGAWAAGAVKWAVLHVFTSALTDGKPDAVLGRLVALLCLLPPVFESGRFLMAEDVEFYVGPSPNLSMLLVGPLSASLACVIWEKGLCGDAKKRKPGAKLNARQLLTRMVKYFKPDVLYLIAAFGFLILGVICKCEVLRVKENVQHESFVFNLRY